MFKTSTLAIAAAVTISVTLGAIGSAAAQEPPAQAVVPPPPPATLDDLLKIELQVAQAGTKSQTRVSKLSDEHQKLLEEYRAVRLQIDNIRIYNKQLEDLIGAQRREVVSLNEQIERATYIEREITPLMLRMISTLREFIELDVPFLAGERQIRLEGLEDLMGRSDVTTGEKFRKLLEAYQIEDEYGRTIEAYRDTLDLGGRSRTVDFLRIGRVALIYQSLDAEEAGVWDNEGKRWIELDDDYRTSIRQGLRIARKQAAPDLLKLPIAAAKAANVEIGR